jgi:hypothetical protein
MEESQSIFVQNYSSYGYNFTDPILAVIAKADFTLTTSPEIQSVKTCTFAYISAPTL